MKFSGQGAAHFQKLNENGNRGKSYNLGCFDSLDIESSVEKWTHKESCSGFRQTDATGVTGIEMSASFSATDWSMKILAELVQGNERTLSGDRTGTVTGETIDETTGFATGDYFHLKRRGATTVVITDSAGSVATVNVAHYAVDVRTGKVTILSGYAGGSYVLPLRVAYTYQEPNWVSLFTQGIKSTFMIFDGVNTQNANSKVVAEFYKVNVNPASSLPLLNEQYASFEGTIDFVADLSRPVDGSFGQFGRVLSGDFGNSFGV